MNNSMNDGMNSSIWNGAGKRIYMQEVGTRDGLQVEAVFVPTEDKVALVNALSEAGLAKIEVTSFTSPKAIPALRDGEIVLREIARKPGVIYSALVPNVRGAERAIDARTDEFNLVMSASETHNLANLRMTRVQSYAALSDVSTLVAWYSAGRKPLLQSAGPTTIWLLGRRTMYPGRFSLAVPSP